MESRQLTDRAATAYLEHLGVDATRGEVDAATLAAIARAHVATVPYENVDIYRGEPPGIEPVSCVDRIVAGRGGYCFHLNGALITLLEWLQVDVTRHVSGVQGGPDAPGPNGNHLGITARLPDGTEWFVDAGLGDGPSDPLPLVFGTYDQHGFTYELRPSSFDPHGWRFEHDPRGAFVGADFPSRPRKQSNSSTMHAGALDRADVRLRPRRRRSCAGPTARSTSCAAASARRSRGSDDGSGDVDSESDWWEIVIDEFGLAYGDLPADERARVWSMVRSAHEAWDAAGRS